MTLQKSAENNIRRRAERLGLRLFRVSGVGYFVMTRSRKGRTIPEMAEYLTALEKRRSKAKRSK